jgi:bifunctional DNase/RNase
VLVFGRVLQRLLMALGRQRVPLIIILIISLGAGGYYFWLNQSNLPTEAAAAGTAPVEVTVQDLAGQNISQMTLTLKEKTGQRRISMAVGTTEALAIARQRGNSQIPPDQQPQAYDLLREAVSQLGGRVERVIVNDANQREYLAQVVLANGGGDVKVIRARPGDAIALALKSNAPIFVEDKVLERYGTKGSS